jgi:hypothetical protein
MAWVRAFFDDTGNANDESSQVFGVVGLVAPSSAWHILQAQWEDVLECHKIESFHAVKFAHFREQFDGWTEYQRKELLSDLVRVVQARIDEIAVVVSVVVMEDYKRLTETQKKRARSPYFVCANWCIIEALHHSEDRWKGKPVALVFDQGSKIVGELNDACSENRKYHPLGSLCESVTRGDHRQISPIQVADLLAYETNKYVTGKLNGLRPRDVRWPVRQLRKLLYGAKGLFNLEGLTKAFRE